MADIANSASELIIYSKSVNSNPCSVRKNRHESSINIQHENFKFSLDTGTSTLRAHLFTHHLDVWVEGCDKFKINITAANAKASVAEYRARKNQGRGTSQSTEGDRPDDLKDFSHEAFVDAITQFIIADDQVGSLFVGRYHLQLVLKL